MCAVTPGRSIFDTNWVFVIFNDPVTFGTHPEPVSYERLEFNGRMTALRAALRHG